MKCVMVLDGARPEGILANTAAILGITLGKLLPSLVGQEAPDSTGDIHSGIIQIPVPILNGNAELLAVLRKKLSQPEFLEVTAGDFTDLAQGCRTYDEYLERMAKSKPESFTYLGLALAGPKKLVSRLTGNLPLLR